MMVLGTGATIAVGAVLLVLVLSGAAILFVGLRAQRRATAVRRDHTRLQAMLRTSPAVAMLARGDGRIEMSGQLADWFGLSEPADTIAELARDGAGLTPDDAALIGHDVDVAHRSGRSFSRVVRPQGAPRALMMHGVRGPGEARVPVVIWVFDVTDSRDELDRLAQEVARLGGAYDALTGLIEAAPMPMWFRGPDLKLQMVNAAYVEAVEGSDAGEVVARGLELIEGSDRGGPLAGATAARERGQPTVQILPATIGGARRMLRVIDVPLSTGSVAGFAVDIEDLEQARSGAKRFAEAQRGMLDRLSAGVAQFGADRALVFSNQPFSRLFAIRPEWLAEGMEFDRVLERMREANRLPEVRDFPGWKAERRNWFVGAEGATEESWHLPGGTHLRVVAQSLPDGGLLVIFEDRTEQVQLASARDTLLRVRTATFDNLFEALGVFAADGRLQLWNNRFRAVWGVDEVFLGTHPRVDAFAAEVAGKLVTPGRAALIPDLVRAATIERQQRGGRVALNDGRHFEFAAVPLPDGNALFTMLDITDSRRAEQALRERAEVLEEADKVKTQFVANMSYELKTPLTSIGGFAEMLHGGYAGELPEQAQSYVEAILDSVERLGLLVDDVLDLTQGGEGLERVDVDLASVAREAASAVQPTIRRRRIDFAVELGRSTGRVQGDARRLREVIEHLLRNALGSLPAGGRLLLHTDGSANRARIIVSDDGPGLDADSASRAFDRFAEPQLQPGGERALGTGLPLARQFVEAHGGTIGLVSEPGQGTLVTVDLPRR